MAAANKNDWVIENYVPSRRMAENLLDDIGKKVLSECYYFQESENCSKFKTYKNEFKKKKGFWTFKQNIRWWDDGDPDFSNRNDVFELKPIRDSRF